MTHQINTTEINTFLQCCSIQLAHTKRTNTNCITDYICVKGDTPLTMSHLKVRTAGTGSLEEPKIELNWHDDRGDIFFLKHSSLTSTDTKTDESHDLSIDEQHDMSKLESALLEWTKASSLHTETTVHGSKDSTSFGISSNEHEQTDLHAALDCLAYLNEDGMINLTSLKPDSSTFTSRTQIISDQIVNEITTSGLRLDETAMLIYDYPINRQLLESVFLNDTFVHSLSAIGIKNNFDLFILSSYDKFMANSASKTTNNVIDESDQKEDNSLFKKSVIKNTVNVLDGLISNRHQVIDRITFEHVS